MTSVHLTYEGLKHCFSARYADIDAQRHLNNVAFFTFAEHARVQYLRQLGLWDGEDFESIGMIVAETSCNYKAPGFLGEDAPPEVLCAPR